MTLTILLLVPKHILKMLLSSGPMLCLRFISVLRWSIALVHISIISTSTSSHFTKYPPQLDENINRTIQTIQHATTMNGAFVLCERGKFSKARSRFPGLLRFAHCFLYSPDAIFTIRWRNTRWLGHARRKKLRCFRECLFRKAGSMTNCQQKAPQSTAGFKRQSAKAYRKDILPELRRNESHHAGLLMLIRRRIFLHLCKNQAIWWQNNKSTLRSKLQQFFSIPL